MATIKISNLSFTDLFSKIWKYNFVRWGVTPFILCYIAFGVFSTWPSFTITGLIFFSIFGFICSIVILFVEGEYPSRLLPCSAAIFLSLMIGLSDSRYATSTSYIVQNIDTKEMLHDGSSSGVIVFVDDDVNFSKIYFKGTAKTYVKVLSSDVVASVAEISSIEIQFNWAWDLDYTLAHNELDFEKVLDDLLKVNFTDNYETMNAISAPAKACNISVAAGYKDEHGNCVLQISEFEVSRIN